MKVLNFGSLNFDYVYSLDHIVASGETISCKGRETFFGGKGLNQSIALSRAGVDVFHAGMVGEDGEPFLELCARNGIHTDYIKKVNGPSGHTVIQVDKNAQNCIILYPGSNRMIDKEFVDEVLAQFESGDIILLQNEISELPYIIDQAYAKGMCIILNPSPYDGYLEECDISKVSIFLINEVEGAMIAGSKEPNEIIRFILNKYPEAKVVLTLGGDGVVYSDKDRTVKQGIFKVKAVDTTAAGDTFTGYFVAGMINNTPIEERLRLCAKASAITVSRAGATDSIPTMEETLAAELNN